MLKNFLYLGNEIYLLYLFIFCYFKLMIDKQIEYNTGNIP